MTLFAILDLRFAILEAAQIASEGWLIPDPAVSRLKTYHTAD
jgi:hypothetical protein